MDASASNENAPARIPISVPGGNTCTGRIPPDTPVYRRLAGLRGRTSGILGFFAVVALIVGGIFNVLPNADRFRPQNADWSPVSVEQARAGFDITAGSGTVDLTRLAITPPLRNAATSGSASRPNHRTLATLSPRL